MMTPCPKDEPIIIGRRPPLWPSRLQVGLCSLLLLITCTTALAMPVDVRPQTSSLGPLLFEAAANNRFLARAPGYNIIADMTGIEISDRAQAARLGFQLVGSLPVRPRPEQASKASTHRLSGRDHKQWRRWIERYQRIRYPAVYPAIDVVYYGREGQLEYDFIVAPGADIDSIRLRISGHQGLQIDKQGNLLIDFAGQRLRQQAPVVYQVDQAGRKRFIAGRYRLATNGLVGFDIAAYDPSRTLIIDPVLVYGSYLGNTGADQIHDLAVDNAGNSYIVGETTAGAYPAITQRRCSGPAVANCTAATAASNDVFVSKFSASGQLLFTTYLGGQQDDRGLAIAVDSNGDIYIAGSTLSRDFPTTAGSFDSTLNDGGDGFHDAFAAKLSADGSRLIYATYLGGAADDVAQAIVTDNGGQLYVSGWTRSADYPLVAPLQATPGGKKDAFVTRLNNLGQPVYSSYLGGQGDDVVRAMAIDTGGSRIYLTGFTASGDHDLSLPARGTRPWPTTPGAYDTLCGQSGACDGSDGNGNPLTAYDAFLTRLDAAGSSLGYSTFLGGGRYDYGNAIAVTVAGDVLIGGETLSADFPATPGSLDDSCEDRGDGQCQSAEGYLLRLSPNGGGQNDLVFATFLGGSATDTIADLAIDNSERIYLAGTSLSDDLPTRQSIVSGPPARPDNAVLTRSRNVFLANLDSSGSTLTFASYLGGRNDDRATAIAVDSGGIVHLAGYTLSADLSVSQGTAQPQHGDLLASATTTADDGFLLRIAPFLDGDLSATLNNDSNGQLTLGQQVRYTATVRNNGLQTAESVTLTDTLPDAVIFDAAQSDPGCQQYSGRLNCSLGALASGEQRQIDIVVRPKNQGSYSHQITVTALQTDSTPADNTASSDTVLVSPAAAATGGSAALGWLLPLALILLPGLRYYPVSGRRTSRTFGN